MRELHWSYILFNFITIEVSYDDGARQAWDYDCAQFATVQDLKLNMAADFVERRPTWESLMVYVTRNGESFSAEVEVGDLTGGDFVLYVFEVIEEMLEWQQAVIS